MEIDGTTRVVVHLAYPSGHLKTPQLFNARVAERGIGAVLVPWQVHPDNLRQVVDALRLSESVAGMIVTIPHKEAVARLCDRLDGPAERLVVANVVRKAEDGALIGRMLDGVAFAEGLRNAGHRLAGARVLMAGAGGVAIAIADALLAAGVTELRVTNRTQARAEKLVSALAADYPGQTVGLGTRDADGVDIVVNATALGMHDDDELPVSPDAFKPGVVVAEVVMSPEETPLLRAAQARGATPHPGRHMLSGQIDSFIDFVLGPERPTARAAD
ncbi:shikimate dehydrogenase family protein [Pseudochelatococcus sp. B33]